MIVFLIISLCCNVALAVLVGCLIHLLRAVTRVAGHRPPAAIADAPPATQAALAIAEGLTGITAEEEQAMKEDELRRQGMARMLLEEEFGYNPEYLEMISRL